MALVTHQIYRSHWECLRLTFIINTREAERSSVRRSSCVHSAREARRAQSWSRRRLSKNARGSSRTIGCSSSMASSNTISASTGTRVRETEPRANCCRRRPCCPKRSVSETSGNAAKARRLRMPQRLRVSSKALADFFSSPSRVR